MKRSHKKTERMCVLKRERGRKRERERERERGGGGWGGGARAIERNEERKDECTLSYFKT